MKTYLYRLLGKTFLISPLILAFGCNTLTPTKETATPNIQPNELETNTIVSATTTNALPNNNKNTPLNREAIQAPQEPDIWERLTVNYGLKTVHSELGHTRIQNELNWYLSQPNYISTINKRAQKYLFYILQELEKRDMPAEIALLPIVESGFDPFAYSYVSASGLWQFMPRTGESLGLKRDWWKDDRRDIVKSTQAALTYLQQLHKRFKGDWLLALAAYNSGAGNVSKAIRKNKKSNQPTDFWHLQLPKQTKHYVPRLLALAKIYNQPKKYNITLLEMPNTPFFAQVATDSQIDLAHAADLAGVSIKEIAMLNPSFNRFATHPNGPHSLLIPASKAEQFKKNLKNLPVDQRVTWQRYTIETGDSLSTIAAKFSMSTETIKAVNQLKSNTIRTGKTLLIPVASDSKRLSLAHKQYKTLSQRAYTPSKKSIKKVYTVKAGDSLWSIARAHDTTVKKLLRWNSLSKRDPLKLGQNINIWFTPASNKRTTANNAALQKMYYKVRKGDSLHRIADKFNLKVSDIIKWNSVKKKYLQPGDKLTLFVDVTNIY